MSPDEVYAMTDAEYRAFTAYARDELKARERAARRRK
jgi:hypothetical protein